MKLVEEAVYGELHIKENSQYNTISADKIIVSENITARLYGNVKDIVLKKGSIIYLHGIISGNVTNEGGEIHIFK